MTVFTGFCSQILANQTNYLYQSFHFFNHVRIEILALAKTVRESFMTKLFLHGS